MPATTTSFMGLLQDAEVDLGAPPLEPFGFGDDLEEEGDEEEEGEDEEEVTEIEEEAFTTVARPAVHSTNYSEAEDILFVRAWAHVGMDASTGTDQTGKRYWQRIEYTYCKIKPKTVKDAPPSETVESDYETIAGLRYKEMAASKGKAFSFKHAWKILQTFDKWKLRDQETAPKKAAMLRMDDSDEEERNLCKPEETKKDKLRKKMEGEASSIRKKMEHMMKSRKTLTMKTLATKLLIIEKKKEVKLAQVEARREEAKRKAEERGRKADLEERMIKAKEAKTWKELMVKEKEHMMMSKKDMDEDQLMWWKDYKEGIAERKRIFRGASSTLRGDTSMSGGGDGVVEDSTTGAYGGVTSRSKMENMVVLDLNCTPPADEMDEDPVVEMDEDAVLQMDEDGVRKRDNLDDKQKCRTWLLLMVWTGHTLLLLLTWLWLNILYPPVLYGVIRNQIPMILSSSA
ncbi:DNA mismatch repair protein Msh6-1 [Hordeum vulgare]|nr:DNA mismatch repair protein Msh6-1 [Hordeum vulgare]